LKLCLFLFFPGRSFIVLFFSPNLPFCFFLLLPLLRVFFYQGLSPFSTPEKIPFSSILTPKFWRLSRIFYPVSTWSSPLCFSTPPPLLLLPVIPAFPSFGFLAVRPFLPPPLEFFLSSFLLVFCIPHLLCFPPLPFFMSHPLSGFPPTFSVSFTPQPTFRSPPSSLFTLFLCTPCLSFPFLARDFSYVFTHRRPPFPATILL